MTDGRRIAVRTSGTLSGPAVFFLHGTPGSRLSPLPRGRLLHALGVRLITFDRPGYGDSDRPESRTVADVVPDVRAIADELGIDRFGVLGRAGGGPHALACAALLPERVTRAGVLVSLAPWAADGLDWFAGMADFSVREYTTAVNDPKMFTVRLMQAAAQIRSDPARHVTMLSPEMPEADRRIVSDAGIRELCWQRGSRTAAVDGAGVPRRAAEDAAEDGAAP